MRIRIPLLSVIIALLVAAAGAQAPLSEQAKSAVLQRANELLARNDIQGAIRELDNAIQTDPKFAKAYLFRAASFARLRQTERALADYATLIKLQPDDPASYLARCGYFNSVDRLDDALRDCEKAIEVEPWNPVAHINTGNIYGQKKNWDRALASFDEALRLDPNTYPATYVRRGIVFLQLGLRHEAELEYRTASRINPKIGADWAAEFDRNRREAPAAPTRPTLAMTARQALAEGIRLKLLKQNRPAIRDLDASLAVDPRSADAYLYRGKAYYDLRQIERAVDDLDRAIELDPKFAEAYRVRGKAMSALADSGRYQDAERDLNRAISLRPDYALAYLDLANVYLRHRGNMGRTIMDLYDKAVALDPDNPYALHQRGAYRVTWDDRRAFEDFNKAITLKPDFAEAYGQRAMASLVLNNNPAAAQSDFEKCFTLKPELRTPYLLDAQMSQRLPAFREIIFLSLHQPGFLNCANYTASSQAECQARNNAAMAATIRDAKRTAELQSQLQAKYPCEGKRGGAMAACVAGDWAAVARFESGEATAQDKARYGKY
jgi:tetratricopeptide (TPR) repeat protein